MHLRKLSRGFFHCAIALQLWSIDCSVHMNRDDDDDDDDDVDDDGDGLVREFP